MRGIALARHGETPYNVERRFQGQTDVPLTDRGRAQATELADAAAEVGFRALWCSPLRRAADTAAIVGARLGLDPQPDPRFMETDTGDWTDRLFADVERDDPEGWAAYHRGGEFRFPGGESLEEQMERVVDGLVAVTRAGVFPALVICHRGVIRCALSHTHVRGLETFHEWQIANGELVEL